LGACATGTDDDELGLVLAGTGGASEGVVERQRERDLREGLNCRIVRLSPNRD